MRKRKTPIEATLEVSRFSPSGEGQALYYPPERSPSPVIIPYAIPGDIVKAPLFRKRGGVYTSHIQEIIQASPLRIAPPCKHFGACGGCSWQQLSYADQLAQKQSMVEHCFEGLLRNGTVLHPIIPSQSEWGYRNKMEYTFSRSSAEERMLGLYKAKSHGRVVNLSECHLAPSWFLTALNAARTWWASTDLRPYHTRSDTGSLRTLTLREGRRSGDRMVILTVSGNPAFSIAEDLLKNFTREMIDSLSPLHTDAADAALSIYICQQKIAKGTPTQFLYSLLHGPETIREEIYLSPSMLAPSKLTFHISPRAFFQPNTVQAEILYQTALTMTGVASGSIVYDLYCGTGTLGMFAAQTAKQVIGIELNEQAVEDAQSNILHNRLNNVHIYQGDVGKVLAEHGKTFPSPDLVMVDPPRSGLDGTAIAQILQLQPKTLLYISCNPASQSKNIEVLVAAGYRLTDLQPVDQFPHTPHIENIAILVSA